ncbi:MAG: DUF4139 domain-containing protein [Firmicutes bacterium]|nr:DUF4139 domain-containing protein [Bacillota bacterium]
MVLLLLATGGGINAGYRPPITEAVIFPDGFAFLVRKGEVALEDGQCVFDLLPPALNGSLEVFSTDSGLVLEEVVAYREEQAEEIPVGSLAELFRANIGKGIELVVDGEIVSGVIKGFLEPHYLVVTTTDKEGGKEKSNDVLYSLELIGAYYFCEPVSLTCQETELKGKLRARFREAGIRSATYPVGLSYLQAGLSWSPEYIINIDPSEQSGIFSFSGVIQNEVDDLVNATVYLAERGPQFPFGLSPLVVFETDQGFAARGGALTMRGVQSDKLAYAPSPELEIAASRVTYNMYRRNDVTLRRGERALLPLYRSGVRVEPLYQVRLARASGSSGQIFAEPVWKVYRVYNNSPFPWIEGRVMLMMAERPLGMGDLPYIARNQSGEIRVMMEPAVRVKASEVEFERVQGGIDFQDREYAFVRIRGEIEIDNTKETELTLKVTHEVPGEVVSIGEGGTVVRKAVLQAGPNPVSELNWEIKVWPRSQQKLTYTYQTYLPIRN